MDKEELMNNLIDLFNTQGWGFYELMEELDIKTLNKIYHNLLSIINDEV